MLICLSSGARPRYRQDIIRAIAMPNGASLQFRYDSKWIAPKIREMIEKGEEADNSVLIAYIDQTNQTKIPELVPCRFAKLAKATSHGTTVSLTLILANFAYAEDLSAFNTEMQLASAGTLPKWTESKSITGSYWLEIGEEPKNIVSSLTLEPWENIVAQLAGRADFGSETCFYVVDGFYNMVSKAQILHTAGFYDLSPDEEYEIRLYHFHPKEPAGESWLRVDTANELLKVTSNPLLSIDSRYDMKHVVLKTGRPSKQENIVLSLYRAKGGQPESPVVLDFDLQCRIKGTFWTTLGYGAILGTLLAGPQIVAALSNPNLPPTNVVTMCIVSSILGMGAGIFAAFGLKKSV